MSNFPLTLEAIKENNEEDLPSSSKRNVTFIDGGSRQMKFDETPSKSGKCAHEKHSNNNDAKSPIADKSDSK